MKVYSVIYDWTDNYEGDCNVELFADREEAINNMKQKIKEIKEEYGYDTFEQPNEDEFYGYNDGCYVNKHDRVRIEELNIKIKEVK